MVRDIVDNFKCSYFFSFLHLHVRSFSFSCFPLTVFYGAAFERMFTNRCLCAIIRQCTITLSLYRRHLLRFLFCFALIVIAASALHILSTIAIACTRSPLLALPIIFICSEGTIASRL